MDLRIAGRTALVTASSQGLGRACAAALIAEGVNVVINGRETDKLEKAAAEIQALATHGASCRFVTADLATDTGLASHLRPSRSAGHPGDQQSRPETC